MDFNLRPIIYVRYCTICRGRFETSNGGEFCCCTEHLEKWKRDSIISVRAILEAGMPKALEVLGVDSIEEWDKKKSAGEAQRVYLVQGGPYYKIGSSKNTVERVRQLSTASPFEIDLIHIIPTDNMRALEKELHERYASKRRNGEWFELDNSDVEYIRSLPSSPTASGSRQDTQRGDGRMTDGQKAGE